MDLFLKALTAGDVCVQQKALARVAVEKPSREDDCVAVILNAQSSTSAAQITAVIVMQMVSLEQDIWEDVCFCTSTNLDPNFKTLKQRIGQVLN